MKIQINKKIFNKHLENISKALNSNSALNSLQGILVTALESSIQLIASNGNLSIKEVIELNGEMQVIEPGKILIPGKLFKDVIKKQADKIDIEKQGDKIIISSQGSKTNINLLNFHEYPIISFDTFGKELLIESEKLKDIIKNVSFAASDGDKRIILNGVNLKASNGVLTAAATNSYRLAYEKLEINSNIDFDLTILSKNLRDFIPNNATGELKISVNDSKIITIHKTTTIVSKLIDGAYPEVERLIADEFENKLIVESKKLEDLIDVATVMTSENSRIVKMDISKELLVINSKRDEVGDTSVKMDKFEWDGEEFSIVFNAQYLKEAISKFKGKIVIKFSGDQKAFVVTGESKPSLIQLVLPRRIY